ncbi:MAG: PH domain-containing protein [Deltaproteobacteria bacterium]|nr:PH domain-containing protein [Deltaproteobacteria bacterium]
MRKRHWVVFLRTLLTPLLTVLALLLVVRLLRWFNVIPSPFVSSLFIGFAPAIMVLWSFMDWQNDYYLLTTTRVIHREKVPLASETLDGMPLSRIQGTNITRGAVGSLLGFGTLEIYVASAKGSIVFDYLPDPEGMRDSIAQQIALLNAQSQQREQRRIRQELLRQKDRGPSQIYRGPPPSGRSVLPSQQLGKHPSDQIDQMIWRKHWAYLVKGLLLPFPLTAILTALIATNVYRWPARYSPYLLPGSLVLWIAGIIWLWWQVEDWRNDIYILTDRLIIDVERKPFSLSDERTQATLDMIQNVSLRIPGPLASLLDYGDLVIETAGPTGVFTFDGVSHPAAVQREVFRRVEAYDESQRRRERDQRTDEFSEWFHIYDELRQHQPPEET